VRRWAEPMQRRAGEWTKGLIIGAQTSDMAQSQPETMPRNGDKSGAASVWLTVGNQFSWLPERTRGWDGTEALDGPSLEGDARGLPCSH